MDVCEKVFFLPLINRQIFFWINYSCRPEETVVVMKYEREENCDADRLKGLRTLVFQYFDIRKRSRVRSRKDF